MKQVLQCLTDGTTQLTEVPAPSAVASQLLIHATASLVSAGIERMRVEFGEAKGLALSNEPARRNGTDKRLLQLSVQVRIRLLTTINVIHAKALVPANASSPG
jgi:hypothetical protein